MSDNSYWTLQSLAEFWRADNMANIKPSNWGEFPEGFDPRKVISHLYNWVGKGDVTELGCGYGRCSSAFPVSKYHGVDINSDAVERAKKLFPTYSFEVITSPDNLPGGHVLMAYTVLLHMPDAVLVPWIQAAQARYNYILVCEILGREWRATAGITPVFNRDLEDYKSLFSPFSLVAEVRLPYQRYVNSEFTSRVKNTDISFMIFGREGHGLSGLAI